MRYRRWRIVMIGASVMLGACAVAPASAPNDGGNPGSAARGDQAPPTRQAPEQPLAARTDHATSALPDIAAQAARVSAAAEPSLAQPSPTEGLPAAIAAELRRLLGQDPQLASANTGTVTPLQALYAARGYDPLWTGDRPRLARSRELIALLQDVPRTHGLPPTAPLASTPAEDLADPVKAAALDVALSERLSRLAGDLTRGRINPARLPETYRARDPVLSREAVLRLAAAPELTGALAELPPQDGAYRGLQDALTRLQEIAAAGGWGAVAPGTALMPGAVDARVPALRRRLRLSGDLAGGDGVPAGEAAQRYDDALVEAVKRAQTRHGLRADGVVGAATRTALNVPVATRIEQIRANLERLRWHDIPSFGRRILVNIPAQTVSVYQDEALRHTARAIIGEPEHMTPEFTERMSYIEINPTWNVPDSIAREELLLLAQRDFGYLPRNGFVVYRGGRRVDPATVNWAAYGQDNFPFRLQQRAGANNALGVIKFMLPNAHNIYLHDTPARHLFARDERAFSHGCIRVEDPLALADVLLAEQGWPRTKLEKRIASGRTEQIRLSWGVPVHLVYRSAWVDTRSGLLHLRRDLYGKDRALAARLTAEDG